MEKYSDVTIEFEYPLGFKVKKYSCGYGICKGKHGLVIDILLVSRVQFAPGNGPEDLLGKVDAPYSRRTVLGEIQYGDKKAFVQYFMKYRDDKFLGKAAELLFDKEIKSPLLVTIQGVHDFDLKEFRPLLESIKIKDVSAFTFEESKTRSTRKVKPLRLDLPDQVKYLEPLVCELNSFDPDELTDDNQEAMDLVEDALDLVIAGMSKEKAIETIKNHLGIVQQLLKQNKLPQAPLAYIQGALLGMLAFKFSDPGNVSNN